MTRRPRGWPSSAPSRALARAFASALVFIGLLVAGCGRYARMEGMVVPPASVTKGSDDHVERTIVWVESHRRHADRAETVELRMTENGFEPAWLCVLQGTTIRFRNTSAVYHKAFCPSPQSGFQLAAVRPGEAIEVQLKQAGEIRVFCELHPEASAVLQILPPGETAHVDEAGRFRLPALPSGQYTLSYWHPSWGSGKRRIEVPSRGVVELELKF